MNERKPLVIGMASYPAPAPRLVAGVDVHAHAPNLMVTTKGGALKLIRVEDAAEEDDSVFLLVGLDQGLTLIHFSAQLEPCLTHKNTSHTVNTP